MQGKVYRAVELTSSPLHDAVKAARLARDSGDEEKVRQILEPWGIDAPESIRAVLLGDFEEHRRSVVLRVERKAMDDTKIKAPESN